jgi:hypothetical protein
MSRPATLTWLIRAAILASLCLFGLSSALDIRNGTAITTRIDVLFSSDLAGRLHNLSGSSSATEELRTHRVSFSHPFMNQVWGTAGGMLAPVVRWFEPEADVPMVTARLLVAIVAGLGMGALFTWAVAQSRGRVSVVLYLCIVYVLFSVNVLVAAPEHMGLSNGVLTLAFVISQLDALPYRRTILVLLAALAAATTVTNGVGPFFALVYVQMRQMSREAVWTWARRLALAGAAAGLLLFAALAATGILTRVLNSDTIVHRFVKVRVLQDPVRGLALVPAALVYPAVAPRPRVVMIGPKATAGAGLTYEPLSLHDFDIVRTVGALSWCVLFGMCAWAAWRDRAARLAIAVPIAWIVFNLLFHSIWGDELFLYAPHWSWALMAIVFAGAAVVRHPWALAALCVLIVPAQIYTLTDIFRLLPR